MTKRVLGLIAAACLGGAVLAACSSGSSTSPTTSTTTSSPASSSTTTTTAAASTTTTTAGPQQCTTTVLNASIYGSSGAAGTIEITVALTSSSSTPCVLVGYTGLQLLNAASANIPTTVVRGGSYSFTSMTPTTLSLSNGQTAYFNMGFSDVPSGSATSCPISTSLEITPPNAYNFLTIPAQLGPCNNGTIAVSPVFSNTGSNGQTMAPAQ